MKLNKTISFNCYFENVRAYLPKLKPRLDMQLVAGNKLHVWTGLNAKRPRCVNVLHYSYTFLRTVVCLSVCLSSVTFVYPALTVRRISMPFGRHTWGRMAHCVR